MSAYKIFHAISVNYGELISDQEMDEFEKILHGWIYGDTETWKQFNELLSKSDQEMKDFFASIHIHL